MEHHQWQLSASSYPYSLPDRDSMTEDFAPSLIPTSELPQWSSVIQINPNSQKLRPKEANCTSIACGAWQLTRQPALALSRIVVGEKMCGACVPAIP